jgi:predicted TIM-barrel fold metal-dependent hydrolase
MSGAELPGKGTGGGMTILPEGYTDFHVHLFPDDFFEAIWDFFKREYGMEIVHQLYARECIEYLREHGVGTVVYSNYAHTPEAAGVLNEWNMKLLDAHRDVHCFAAFHPDEKDALPTARDLLEHPGVLGFKLHFLVQPFSPDDERLFPLYELVTNRGKRLLLHIGTGPIGNERVGAKFAKRLLARYPSLSVTIAHMGAFEFEEFFALLETHPGLFLDTAFCFLPGNFRMYRLGTDLLERYSDRLLYGSDFPNIFHHRDEEITALEAMNLSPEFYRRVFKNNAERLLGRSRHRF